MNKLFVIEGTDGSGKQTQTEQLKIALTEMGLKIISASFPNYESLSSGPVREYLNGNISNNANDISAKAASSFFAIDRYITFNKEFKKYYLDNDTIIISDRYTQSNLIHEGSKFIARNDLNKNQMLDQFSDWLYNFEYVDLELPKPTATIYLHVPTDVTIELIKNRNNKITNMSEKDINERDISHLYNSEKAGLYYARSQNWHIIECVKDNKMRTIKDISNEIIETVKIYL
jgi:dTMP kinase